MILQVQQVTQDLFAADFQILRGNQSVGNMIFRGKISTPDGHWNVSFYNHSFELGHNATIRQGLPKKAYRPYQIYMDQQMTGYVFNDTVKESFFRSYSVARIYLKDMEYVMYFIGFGAEGTKNPIYCNGKQVALIEKDCTVYNGLYQYRLLALDENAAQAGLMFCAYMYSCTGYEPGVKVTKSIQKVISTTTNKTVLSQFDPGFYSRVEP